MARKTIVSGAAYAVLIAVCLAIYAPLLGSTPFVSQDSSGYLYFHVSRPIGYPAFLGAMKALTGDYSLVPAAQLALMTLSAAALAAAVEFYCRSILAGLALLVVLAANFSIFRMAGNALSEPLALVLESLFLGGILVWRRTGSRSALWGAAAFAAAAIATRPVNITLAAPFVLLTLLPVAVSAPRGRLAGLAVSLVILGIGYEATPIAHRLLYGPVTESSPFARGLFQKAMFLPPPANAEPYRACIGADAYDAVDKARSYVDQAPAGYRAFLKYRFSDYLRFNVVIPGIAEVNGLPSGSEADAYLMCYVRLAIAEQPVRFLVNNAWEYWRLLSFEPFLHDRDRRGYEDYITSTDLPLPPPRPEPPQDRELSARLKSDFGIGQNDLGTHSPGPAVLRPADGLAGLPRIVMRLAIAFCTLSGFAALLFLPFAKQPAAREDLMLCLGLAAALHGAFLITATVEFGLSRYLFIFWPTLILCGLLFIRAVWSEFALQHSSLAPSGRR